MNLKMEHNDLNLNETNRKQSHKSIRPYQRRIEEHVFYVIPVTCTFILLCQGDYLDLSGHYITYRGHRESQGTDKPPCRSETDRKRKFYFLPSSTAFFENGMIDKKETRVLKIIF